MPAPSTPFMNSNSTSLSAAARVIPSRRSVRDGKLITNNFSNYGVRIFKLEKVLYEKGDIDDRTRSTGKLRSYYIVTFRRRTHTEGTIVNIITGLRLRTRAGAVWTDG